jgi:hypothetical protein
MHRVYRLLFILTAVMYSVMPAQAQSCPTYAPNVYGIYSYCSSYYVCQPGIATTLYVNGSTIQSCDSVQWDFGDGATASLTGSDHVQHTFAAAGTYNVKVTVTNPLGTATRSNNFSFYNGIIAFSPYYVTVHENTGVAHLTVTRSSGAGTASVNYATQSGSALANVRFTPVSGTLSFGAGETSKNIDVPLISDNVWDPDQVFYVKLTSPDGSWYVDSYSSQAQVTITDDATPARIAPDGYSRTVVEGTPFTVNLIRSGDTVTPVAVSYTLIANYYTQVASGTVNFGAGETTKPIVLTIARDNVYTGTRSFSLNLWSTSPGAQLIDSYGSPSYYNSTSVGLQVLDIDQPVNIQFDSFDLTVLEDVGTLQFGLTRSGDVTTPVTIGYVMGSGFGSSSRGSGNVTFASGQTHATIPIPIAHDTVWTPDRTFYVSLNSPPFGTRYLDASGAPNSCYYCYYVSKVTITDDTKPVNVTFESFDNSVHENAGQATIGVLRSSNMALATSISYTVTTANAGTPLFSGALNFAPNQARAVITIPVTSNAAFTGDRTEFVNLIATPGVQFLGSTGTPVTWGTGLTANLKILDDNSAPAITVSNISVVEGNAGTTDATFTITLSSILPNAFTLAYTTADGSAVAGVDYIPASGTITFNSGELSKTVTVKVKGNTVPEPNKTFRLQVTLSSTPGLAPDVTGGIGICTILNDDLGAGPPLRTLSVGEYGYYIVQLGLGVATPQTIAVATTPPGIVDAPASLYVPAGATSVELKVLAKSPGNATITFKIPAAFGGGTFTVAAHVLPAVDLILDPSALTLAAGASATVDASLNPPAADSIIVAITTANSGSIGVPATVVIPPGGHGTFKVDGLKSGVGTVNLTLPPQFGNKIFSLSVEVGRASTTPILTAVNPTGGGVAGGTSVTLTGANLTSDCSIAFGGVPAASKFVDAFTMTATTPAHVAGTVSIGLSCGAGSFTLQNAFTYVDVAPTLIGVSPSFGGTGGGTLVRLTGTNFRAACWPFFDGMPARGAKVWSATSMTASTPPHALGSVDVSMHCGPISFTLAKGFSYSTSDEPAPVVTGVDPLAGSAGQSVTILGVRFRTSDTVTFGSTPAAILSITPEALVVRVPDLPLGKIAVTVADDKGHFSTTGPIFTVIEPLPPQITSLTPSTAAPGAEIAIDGKGFRPGYAVAFGGKIAPYVSLDYTHVVVRLPKTLSAGTYGAEMWNANNQTASIGPSLTVVDGGVVINGLSPRCATTDGNVEVTINGGGFVNGATATFNGIVTNVKFVDGQTLIATAPPNTTGLARVVVTNPNGDSASLSDSFHYDAPPDPDGGCAVSKRRAAR